MSMLNSRKNNKKVVRLKFMQPCTWDDRHHRRYMYSLKEIAEDGKWESNWFEPAWKSLDGRDLAYYYEKRDELSEIFLSMTRINCRNSYIAKLNKIQLNLQYVGLELDKIYTDIVTDAKRAKTFMAFEAPSIEVDK
jgi:hypothetical protein